MSVVGQTFSSFSNDAVTYIAEKTLIIAKKAVIFQQLSDKAVLPHKNSKTFQYTRYDRMALPLVSLTEGTTPDNSSVAISTVQATVDQWGAYVLISDVADITIKHPVLQKAIDLMGYQAAETVERETLNVLFAGTNIAFGGTATARSGLAATDVMTTTVVRKAVSALRAAGAHEAEGNDFVGVVDPYVEMDLSADTTFQLAASYSNIKVLQNGEIGSWMGVRWMRSNMIPVISGVAQSSFSSNASPVGTFTTATYRACLAYYDALTGFLVKLEANTGVSMTNTHSLLVTTPASTAYKYKIFVGAAAGGATAIMYQGVETTAGTDFIGSSVACSVKAPPSSGLSIAGSDIPAATPVNVHSSWIFGKEAFVTVELEKLQSFMVGGVASDSDPLAQRRKAGWKILFKAAIMNQNFLVRIETGSAFN